MRNATPLKTLIEDLDIALIFMREGLRQTEILDRNKTKVNFPDIEGRKNRLKRSIARFEKLKQSSCVSLSKIEKQNEEERVKKSKEKPNAIPHLP